MNDYPGEDTSLEKLLSHDGLENVLDRLPEDDRWTNFTKVGISIVS